MPGFIYVLRDRGEHSNEIKVGYSIHPHKRARELHTTGTIWKMAVYSVWEVTNMRLAEKTAHEVLHLHRVRPGREFFEIMPPPHFTLAQRHDAVDQRSILWHLTGLVDDAIRRDGLVIDWDYNPSL